MKILFLLRGCPGAGKSTFIKQNNLTNYTLDIDELSLKCAVPMFNPEIMFDTEKMKEFKKYVSDTAKNYLLEHIETRMQNNETIIVDGVHDKQENIERYYALLHKYQYEVYCIDFSDVPLKKCKLQNRMRVRRKWVPEEKIDKRYKQLQEQILPNNLKILKPNEFLEKFNFLIKDN